MKEECRPGDGVFVGVMDLCGLLLGLFGLWVLDGVRDVGVLFGIGRGFVDVVFLAFCLRIAGGLDLEVFDEELLLRFML